MPRCFVIQPFDKGAFDKRYDDVFVPAIEKAGLEPYRVDRDHSASIPIETIEENIRDSDCCLADISLDNPNVWYEVGFAFACGREVVLVCSEERTKFPFDVTHRNIITYTTHAPRDFEKLSVSIVNRLRAVMAKEKTIKSAISVVKEQDGLAPHELTTLVLLVGDRVTPDVTTYPNSILQDVEKAGFTPIAATLALESLRAKGLIELSLEMSYNGEEFTAYKVTDAGVAWCQQNQDRLILRKPSPKPRAGNTSAIKFDDDDIPF